MDSIVTARCSTRLRCRSTVGSSLTAFHRSRRIGKTSSPSYVASFDQQLWLTPTRLALSLSGSRPAALATTGGKQIGPSQKDTIGMSVLSATACETMLTGFV